MQEEGYYPYRRGANGKYPHSSEETNESDRPPFIKTMKDGVQVCPDFISPISWPAYINMLICRRSFCMMFVVPMYEHS